MTDITQNINNTVLIADTPTVNGRIYPLEEVKREVEKLQSLLPISGENGDNPSYGDAITINLMNVSHIVTKVWMEDNEVKAEVDIIDTTEGMKIKEEIEAGLNLKLIPRGTGLINEKNNDMVVAEYDLITIDITREK